MLNTKENEQKKNLLNNQRKKDRKTKLDQHKN